MAGEITEYEGEAFPADGLSVGYLPQEPRLNSAKTVAGNVEEGVEELRSLLGRYDDTMAALSSVSSDLDAVLEEQGRLQDQIEAAGTWDLDSRVAMAMDALRLPPGTADVRDAVGVASAVAWPCAGCYCRLRTCCCSTSRPTTSMPKP